MVLVVVIKLIIDKNRAFHQLRNLEKRRNYKEKGKLILVSRTDMLRRNVEEHEKQILARNSLNTISKTKQNKEKIEKALDLPSKS